MPEQHLTLSVHPRGLRACLVLVLLLMLLVSIGVWCHYCRCCQMVLVLGGVGVAVGSVCVDAARGEWRSTYDVRRAMRRATRGARWTDQERTYVGTTCKVEETTRLACGKRFDGKSEW